MVLEVICILCVVSYDFCLCSFSSPLWKVNICPEESFACAAVAVVKRFYCLTAVEPTLWKSKSQKFPGEVMIVEWIKGWS